MFEIISPITGEKLQVALNDFEEKMTWDQAKSACKDLGNGWRLPTIKELKVMYKELHEKGKGNFKDDDYWSSTEDASNGAYSFYFGNGGANYGNYGSKSDAACVRAVRAL
jgi:hypothetical protein